MWKRAVLGLLTIVAPGCDAGADDAEPAASGARELSPAVRLVAPLSATTVTSRRPTLRWANDGAVVLQICRERACTHVIEQRIASDRATRPEHALAPGVYFWRVACVRGGHAPAWSAVWELRVPARPQPVAVDSSGGIFLDVNGDGFADLAVRTLDNARPEYDLDVFLGGASGLAATAATSVRLAGDPNAGVPQGFGIGAVGDLNGDGFGELALASAGVAKIYAGSAAGLDPTPRELAPPAGTNGYLFARNLAAGGDIDGDGYGELVVTDFNQRVWIYRGGPGGVASTPTWTLGQPDQGIGTIFIGAADFDGDGYSDVALSEYQGNSGKALRVVPGGPAGLADPASVPTWPSPGTFGTVGDVDADGYPDLLLYDRFTEVNIFRGGPSGPGTTPPQVLTVDADGYSAQTGDVNGDGRDDVVIVRMDSTDSFYFTRDRVDVHLAGATGVADAAAVTLEEEAYVGDIENNFGDPQTLADFDRDGRRDLALSAAPPYPTPFFETRPSYVFAFAGSAAGVDTTASPVLSGIPGFGANLASGPTTSR
jgi:hypothetical protein